jgi:hypothetical protein
MRMWMCNPRILCEKHLTGEHVEHHMFAGTLAKGISVQGYIDNNLFEPLSIIPRHNALAREMNRRGMSHTTPIDPLDIKLGHLTLDQLNYKVDIKASLEDLLSRCPDCLRNAKRLSGNIDFKDSYFTDSIFECPKCKYDLSIILYTKNEGPLLITYNIGRTCICPNCKSHLSITPILDLKIEVI